MKGLKMMEKKKREHEVAPLKSRSTYLTSCSSLGIALFLSEAVLISVHDEEGSKTYGVVQLSKDKKSFFIAPADVNQVIFSLSIHNFILYLLI
jgi:hypothetical protein